MSSGHPRLATWILTHCAPEYRRDSFIGDLIEQYGARGSWWYWRQALGAVRTYSLTRLLTATEPGVPAAEYVADLVTAIALALFAFNQVPFFAEVFLRPTLFHSRSAGTLTDTLVAAAFLVAVAITHMLRARSVAAPRQGNQLP